MLVARGHNMKRCSTCNKEKDLELFDRQSSTFSGYRSSCKQCRKTKRSLQKDIISKRNKAYLDKNKEEVNSRRRQRYLDNIEENRAKKRVYYYKNKDSIKELARKRQPKKSAYAKRVYHENINVRLHTIVSGHIRKSLSRKQHKTSKYLALFGYSIPDLKVHLEDLFVEGMSWDNFGEWHIDHIKPKVLFDCSDEEQLKQCWSLDNLQPLWAVDNLRKGDRYVGE